jgi:hypothetical protein
LKIAILCNTSAKMRQDVRPAARLRFRAPAPIRAVTRAASPGRFSPPDALSVDAFGNCAHNFSYFQSLSPPAYFHD